MRDATLFILLMGKSFMWMEIVGLGLALLAIPVAVFVGEAYQYTWHTGIIEGQRWNIQKGLIVAVSVMAPGHVAAQDGPGLRPAQGEVLRRAAQALPPAHGGPQKRNLANGKNGKKK